MIATAAGYLLGGVVLVFLLSALTGAPYVPTRRREAREAFTVLRPLTADDVVLDIGSGDGAVLREIAETKARAVGYEINPVLVGISWWRLRHYRKTIRVSLRNFWSAPFPDDTTVVYAFGDSRDIAKMYNKVEKEASRLGRSIDLVSFGFAVPGRKSVATHRAYFLYTVATLHRRKP